jgi:SAM-dependent methyltransferase
LGKTTDSWLAGDAYEHFMGRWSRHLAVEFIGWLAPSPSWRWLEIGCGTGALTQTILQLAAPASLVACDPSPQFIGFARQALVNPAVTFLVASASGLPQGVTRFDVVVSGLVLNFLPDPQDAVRAMGSRLRPGGVLAAYVWDYEDGMQFLRIFWETAVELDPRAASLDERRRFPLCHPDALAALLKVEGYHGVDTQALEIPTSFPDFDSSWVPFLGGTGPAPSYVKSLQAAAREELRLRLMRRLAPRAGDPVQLTARAWAVRGVYES